MPSLTGQISFAVNFNLTGNPKLELQASTTIPDADKPLLIGYFRITQPDGITVTGNYGTPDVAWNGSGYPVASFDLRLASDQTYQRGTYLVEFFASRDGYTPGEFSRQWAIDYQPVEQTLTENFDCFTPDLSYEDETDYAVSGYSITAQTNAWNATSTPGNPTSTSTTFDLAIGGEYYDSSYAITHVKNLTYQKQSDTWLTVTERYTSSFTAAAFIPASMAIQLGYLINLKAERDAAANCQGDYDRLHALWEEASVLYSQMRNRVCAQNTDGLINDFEEFYRLTHNYQAQTYVNTNTVIPAYDFTTGCGGSGGGGTSAVVVKCTIGQAAVVTPSGSAVPTGLTDGSGTVTSTDFGGKRVRVYSGGILMDEGDNGLGNAYYTKVLASNDVNIVPDLVTDQVIRIETIP
jgi:hypothetical protein